MKKISIIVPVCNAEKYLQETVDSILAQTHENIELILVDDGSVDSSNQICDEYAKKDNRVKVLHQKNQGVSVARNNGIQLSTGEWLGFVDADDTIFPNMYAELLEMAEATGVEVLLCDAIAVRGDEIVEQETIESLTADCVLSQTEILPTHLLEMAGAVWRGFYSSELIKKHEIRFPENLKISEDRIFNLYAMGAASKIAYKKRPYYKRRLLAESTVHKYHADYFTTVKKGRAATVKALKEAWGNQDSFQIAYLDQFVYGSIRAIENCRHKNSPLSKAERRQQIKQICNDEELIDAIVKSGYAERDYRARLILQKKIGRLDGEKTLKQRLRQLRDFVLKRR